MHVFHPTMPNMVLKPLYRADIISKTTSSAYASVTAPAPLPGAVGTETPIPPAPPPSAVQMQIKALISEQALTREADKQEESQA
jgi:hypothetical protein